MSKGKEASKKVHVQRLYPDKSVESEHIYYVVPEGPHSFIGSSDSNPLQYEISFVVTGDGSKSESGNVSATAAITTARNRLLSILS